MVVPATLGQMLLGTSQPAKHVGCSVSRHDVESVEGNEEGQVAPKEGCFAPPSECRHCGRRAISESARREADIRAGRRIGVVQSSRGGAGRRSLKDVVAEMPPEVREALEDTFR